MWSFLFKLLVVGYYTFSRAFAYVGIAPWHLFIGEIVLVCFLLAGPVVANKTWLSLIPQLDTFRTLFYLVVVLILLGVAEALMGISRGYPALTCARDMAFDYYSIFIFLGIWYGMRHPNQLARIVRMVAWTNGFYGLFYVLYLNQITWIFPGVSPDVAQVNVFGQPQGAGAAILGLICLEKDLRKVLLPLLLNVAVLIGMVVRGDWVAFLVALLIYSWVRKQLKRTMAFLLVVAVLFGVMFLLDFSIPVPTTRAEGLGTLSARSIVGRALAPVAPDLAARYTPDVDIFEGTTAWRLLWWGAIWESSRESKVVEVLGHGYGYPLTDLVPSLEGEEIRTPHNFLMYALGYTGWIGVAIFMSFQGYLAYRLIRIGKLTGQYFGIVLWTFSLISACFAPFFEVPHGAIPFYLLTGCVLGTYTATSAPHSGNPSHG